MTFLDYTDKEINELGTRGIGEIGLRHRDDEANARDEWPF